MHVHIRLTGVSMAACLLAGAAAAASYSWQHPHAKVLPTGDLQWDPEPFAFDPGATARYIDHEDGDDRRDGTTPATAWRHHPLDPAAAGQAKDGDGVDTFVFKRGVVYRGSLRGSLRGKLVGTAERPIRLTSDPAWGSGEAVICGSEQVATWTRGAGRDDMPDADLVWRADIPFAPRAVWQRTEAGITRVPLARTPNWTVTDPEDVMSNWWQWEQPQWWTDQNKTSVGGKAMHLGVDTKHLAGKPSDYLGGHVWSEWGIVMGTPYASAIESFDAAKCGLGFQGFWYGDSGKIITGNRYFLEDRPNFLDEAGEYWFDRKGEGGTLYVRLPGDADPNATSVEAACRINLMDFAELRHVRISGLTFRFSNVFWDLTARSFVHEDVEPAAIRLCGTGVGVRIDHCRFEHVNKAIRIKAIADTDLIDGIVIADNDIAFTDHGAIELADSGRWGKKDPPFGEIGDVKVLRNRLSEIGRRPFRSDSAHALCVNFAATAEIAGNMLDRCYGAGIFVFGGKGSEETRDRPLTRILIHHNKVTQPLLAANDWGGIETWQGGPAYVFSNISGNPGGYWNWAANEKPGNARLGFAYYLDGAFKNYHFNNIAWGANNDLGSKYCNRTAFYHALPTVLNAFFNNTAYRFAEGSSWSPAGGRQLFLGNVWVDISRAVFQHGRQKEDEKAVYDSYPLETVAYARNVFEKTPAAFGNLEGSGSGETDFDGFRRAAAARRLMASEVGEIATTPTLENPAGGDFRPSPGSAAIDQGVRFFAPWALSRTVGEWHFRRNHADPADLLDEHWYMSPGVLNRETYRTLPRYDLRGTDIAAHSFEDGPLEDWTAGALRFDGRGSVLTLPPPAETASVPPARDDGATMTHAPADWVEITTPAAFIAGRETPVVVRLKDAPPGHKLLVHLHWLKPRGWGGFITLAQSTPDVGGEGTYRFMLKPEARDGLEAYSLLVALSTTGEWKDNVRCVDVRVPSGMPASQIPARLPGPHDTDGNFLVETVFRSDPACRNGALVSCIGARGYELVVDGSGALTFRVRADTEAQVNTPMPVADGQWHHVIAEADRDNDRLRLYLDGKLAAEQTAALRGSARHDGDLRVGRGADANPFIGSLEFLRIALGTLGDSKTSIEELYAWQFDGPFLYDFSGCKPTGAGRDAGAVERMP